MPNPIYYVLWKSPFTIDEGPYKFYFSSELHLKKYQENVEKYVDKINKSLTKRFGFPVNFRDLATLRYYAYVETRGFYILYEGEPYKCLRNLELTGEASIKKLCLQPLECSTQSLQG